MWWSEIHMYTDHDAIRCDFLASSSGWPRIESNWPAVNEPSALRVEVGRCSGPTPLDHKLARAKECSLSHLEGFFSYLHGFQLEDGVGDLDYILSSMIPLSSVKVVKKHFVARAPCKYYARGYNQNSEHVWEKEEIRLRCWVKMCRK